MACQEKSKRAIDGRARECFDGGGGYHKKTMIEVTCLVNPFVLCPRCKRKRSQTTY